MLTDAEARALALSCEKSARVEWARLNRFTRYVRGDQKLPWLPDGTQTEYAEVARKSASNWLSLVVRSTSQGLYVAGYGDTSEESVVWVDGWQANGMDARQHALFDALLSHGYAFLLIMPVVGGVWMRPEAASNMWAHYDEPQDEWPTHALRSVAKGVWEFYDEEGRWTFRGKDIKTATVEVLEHGLGRCPVVKVQRSIDLLGTPMGEVEPVIPIQDRIVDATFNLQMVAKYGAFPQRWMAGVNLGQPLTDDDGNVLVDADGNPIFPTIKAYVDSIIAAADPDTKFGQFTAADLGGFIEALEAHIRHLAAITQTPPHYLLGSLVNLSAEALAAAEAGLQRKIAGIREVVGEGIEQALRLAAAILGDEEAAGDMTSQVRWQDVESRSLAQTSDALLKLSQLGVPRRKLFAMIPGWTDTDAAEAASMVDGEVDLFAELLAGQTSPDGIPT